MTHLHPIDHPQLVKLNAAIAALVASQRVASRGDFFDSYEGKAAINALHDLLEVDALYELAQDIKPEVEIEFPKRLTVIGGRNG